MEFASAMRPLFARAVAEHEALMAEAGAPRYLRKEGWLKLYRSERGVWRAHAASSTLAQEFGIPYRVLDHGGGARARAERSRRSSITRCIGRAPPASPIRWR